MGPGLSCSSPKLFLGALVSCHHHGLIYRTCAERCWVCRTPQSVGMPLCSPQTVVAELVGVPFKLPAESDSKVGRGPLCMHGSEWQWSLWGGHFMVPAESGSEVCIWQGFLFTVPTESSRFGGVPLVLPMESGSPAGSGRRVVRGPHGAYHREW